jgi:hypothetical protein
MNKLYKAISCDSYFCPVYEHEFKKDSRDHSYPVIEFNDLIATAHTNSNF